jgi:hypothetical protein
MYILYIHTLGEQENLHFSGELTEHASAELSYFRRAYILQEKLYT